MQDGKLHKARERLKALQSKMIDKYEERYEIVGK